MNEPWTRTVAAERAEALLREAERERMARRARAEASGQERHTTLLALPILGRLTLRVELRSR